MYIVLAILDGKNSTAEKRSLHTWYPCVHLLNNNCLPSLPSTCDASKNPRWLDNKGYYFHSATPQSEHDWIERFPCGIFINVFHCGSLGIHNNSVLKRVMYKVFLNNFKTKEQVREYGEFSKAPILPMPKEKDKDRNKPKQNNKSKEVNKWSCTCPVERNNFCCADGGGSLALIEIKRNSPR